MKHGLSLPLNVKMIKDEFMLNNKIQLFTTKTVLVPNKKPTTEIIEKSTAFCCDLGWLQDYASISTWQSSELNTDKKTVHFQLLKLNCYVILNAFLKQYENNIAR